MAHNYSYEQLMTASLAAQCAFTFSYFISSLVVVGNAYSGFNAVILSFVFIAVIALMYMKMRKDVSRTMFGIVLGLLAVLVFVTLESSIFWGQYGSCDTYNNDDLYPTSSPTSASKRMLFDTEMIENLVYPARRLNIIGVQCKHKPAMRSVCAFSVFMFLSYLFQIALLIRYKDEILKTVEETGGYAPVPSGASIKATSSSSVSSNSIRLPPSMDV